MRRLLIPLALLCILTVCGCRARHATPELQRLDAVLKDYPAILERYTAHIDSIRRDSTLSPFDREMALQGAYGSFSLDSAISHSHRALKLAATPGQTARARMALARHYNTSGVMYLEAAEMFDSVSRAAMEADGNLFDYYSFAVQHNRNLATHSLDPELKAMYLQRKAAYRDSALMLQPDNEVLLAYLYMDGGDYRRAIEVLQHDDDEPITRGDAPRYNVLAQVYTEKGDSVMAAHYLTLSATCDLTFGVREYLSLQQLAMLLYNAGDYDRAYRYIHHSIADATACNAKLRMLEMSTMLPIIEQAYEDAERRQHMILMGLFVLVVMLSIALVFVIGKIRRKNRILQTANDEQQRLNDSLALSDSIKEEYLTRFMNLCLEYLAQMEKYRRQLLRIATRKSFDELVAAINKSTYIAEGVNDFYRQFDEAFLNMFPTFIDDLKRLTGGAYQPRFKNGEVLNTELRILALMRLGFTDSESICRFLRCSVSTVYNYRARLRALAVNKDTFDADVMKLGR